MSFPFGGMFGRIVVEDERVPKDEIWLVSFNPDGTVRKSTPDDPDRNVFIGRKIRVDKIINIGE